MNATQESLGIPTPRLAKNAVFGLQVLLGIATPLALISIGGIGIYSAPVLLPLLCVTAAASGNAGRWYFTILAALLMGEVMWAVAWSLVPSLEVALPLAAIVLTPVFFFGTFRKSAGSRASVVIVAILVLVGFSGIASLAADPPETSSKIIIEPVERKPHSI